jgi:hypothetical protein
VRAIHEVSAGNKLQHTEQRDWRWFQNKSDLWMTYPPLRFIGTHSWGVVTSRRYGRPLARNRTPIPRPSNRQYTARQLHTLFASMASNSHLESRSGLSDCCFRTRPGYRLFRLVSVGFPRLFAIQGAIMENPLSLSIKITTRTETTCTVLSGQSRGLQGCERLKIPHCLDNRLTAGEVLSQSYAQAGRPLPPGKILVQ